MTTFLYGAHINANNIRQHYLRYGGKGPPLIIVPGITSPAITWGFVGERFAQSFDTYIVDARGRGLSEAHNGLDYGLDALADDLAAFIAALGLVNPSILGHSMGARIAIRSARRHTLPLHRLVLADPPVSGPGRRSYPAQLSWYIDSIRLAKAGCSAEQMRHFLPLWTHAQLQLRAEWLHTCDETAVIRSFNDFHETDIHVDLPSITTATLLLIAGKAGVVNTEDAQEFARLMPSLTIKTVADSGHMIPWDALQCFIRAVELFVDTEPPAMT